MVRKTDEDAYFAASNSAGGFFSYYKECFDGERIGHVYAIKGGPGTGKSYFLRAVSDFGEERGWRSEKIYCSSDPDSLDGVLLFRDGEGLAFLDATAPHVYEPKTPGLREDIVNLGAFWDVKVLQNDADSIQKLQQKKSEAYRRAYRYLASVGEMTNVRDSLVYPFLKLKGVERFAEKLTRNIPVGKQYSVQPALISSVGMKGETRFDTYFAKAEQIYCIDDCKGIAAHFMRAIGACAMEKKQQIRISYDPILPERIDGIFFAESKIAFVVCRDGECNYPHKTVRLRRFVRVSDMRPIRAEVGYAQRMMRAMLDGAIEELERVKEAHFELEKLYMKAMDFDAKENFTKSFCEAVLT